MRKKIFLRNLGTSLVSQIIAIVSGFIVPLLIMQTYGSQVNGLVSSINQFLAVISLSEMGMAVVVRSSLYKMLAENNNIGISRIIISSTNFYRRIGAMLIVYALGLSIFYPIFIHSGFDFVYVSSLIMILSINLISQYLLGITNSQLLTADQRMYVLSITNSIVLVLNTAVCVILIRLGASIHLVKLLTVSIFLIKPIVSELYVRNHYQIDKHLHYDEEPIKQKWNGIAQHITFFVFTSTDVIVLTLFSNLENVSIYSVYLLILSALNQLCLILQSVVQPILGEFRAKNDMENLAKYFSVYEWFMHTSSVLIFGSVAILIVPFIRIYTVRIEDTNYIVPIFAFLMTVAVALQNARATYNSLIQAIGHYRQTQNNYIIVAIINVIVSVILVSWLGLIGVAIGTLVAVSYQMLWQITYLYRNILSWPITKMWKLLAVDVASFSLGCFLSNYIDIESKNYFELIMQGIPILIIFFVITTIFSLLFYRKEFLQLKKIIKRA